jgi:peptidoglycan/LPS O-acetylase OafA/YrhL
LQHLDTQTSSHSTDNDKRRADVKSFEPMAPSQVHPSSRSLPLDALRGVAILSVMVYHFTGVLGHTTTFGRFLLCVGHQGWVGVDLFFVLSGYLITGILWDERRARVRSYFVTFYARRTLRIFPLYCGVIALVLLLGTLVPAFHTPDFVRLTHLQPWLWLYSVNFGLAVEGIGAFRFDSVDFTHFWTLAIEEQFYLIWPLVVRNLSRKSLMRLCVTTVVVSFVARAGWIPITPLGRNLLQEGIGSSGSLAIGAFVALLRRDAGDISLMSKGGQITFALASAVYLSLILSGYTRSDYLVSTVGVLLLGLAFGSLVLVVETGPNGRRFSSRTLQFFGTYSYGLYVFHHLLNPIYLSWNFRPWFRSYTVSMFVWLAVVSMVTIGISLASWHLFEKRILSFKRFFRYDYAAETSTPTRSASRPAK